MAKRKTAAPVDAPALPDGARKVVALARGHARPADENAARTIEAGEEFYYAGTLGKWMAEVAETQVDETDADTAGAGAVDA